MKRLTIFLFATMLPSILFAQVKSPNSFMKTHHVKSKKRSDGVTEYFDREGRPNGFVIRDSLLYDSIHTVLDPTGLPVEEIATSIYPDAPDSFVTEVSKTMFTYAPSPFNATIDKGNKPFFRAHYIYGQGQFPDTLLILSRNDSPEDSLILVRKSILIHDEQERLIKQVDYYGPNLDQYQMKTVYEYKDNQLIRMTIFNKNGKWVKSSEKATQAHYSGEKRETKTVQNYSYVDNKLLAVIWKVMLEDSDGTWKLDEKIEFKSEYDEKGFETAVIIKNYSIRELNSAVLTKEERLTYEYQFHEE